MKTYSDKSMKGMAEMKNMYEMSHMIYMQNMYLMMQNMYQMMIMMQGMNPMMAMNEISQMNPMTMRDDEMRLPIPMLANLQQVSSNQIQISYDMDVDVRLGMKPTNYWMQDTMNIIPEGIATLGKNERVNDGNSFTSNNVRIESKNGSAKTFIFTFNQNIQRGREYRLIICYVTVKGAPPYSGDNGMATFIGK